MTNAGDRESELRVCAQLLRALVHRIRGDLSVVTNDLAYIATMVGSAEVERSRNRCSAISAGLAHLGTLGSCGDTKEALPLKQVLGIFGISTAPEAIIEGVEVAVSYGLIELAAQLLRELVGKPEGVLEDCGDSNWIAIALRVPAARRFAERYGSLGAFAAAQLGERFIVEAGLLDLIFRDHRWVVAVLCEDHRTTVRLGFASMQG
jgi:hypothetical protein